jgi:hypothetical protein
MAVILEILRQTQCRSGGIAALHCGLVDKDTPNLQPPLPYLPRQPGDGATPIAPVTTVTQAILETGLVQMVNRGSGSLNWTFAQLVPSKFGFPKS